MRRIAFKWVFLMAAVGGVVVAIWGVAPHRSGSAHLVPADLHAVLPATLAVRLNVACPVLSVVTDDPLRVLPAVEAIATVFDGMPLPAESFRPTL